MIYETVTVTPAISDNVIEVTPILNDNVISVDAEIINQVKISSFPEYTGEIEVTPSTETQTLITKNTEVLENITINPIPNNYGLIAWDGITLTVS